jgi:excisionase family DNA binding protein
MEISNTHRKSYSPDEVGHRNGLGRTTVFAEIKAGRLRAKKVGKRTIITDEDEKAWLESLPEAAA